MVGILPRDFRLQLPKEAFQVTDGDLWAPIQFDYGQPLPRNLTFFTVFGRLAPKVTMEQAQAEMNLIAEQFRSEFKEHAASNLRIRAVPLHYDVVKHARPALFVLLGAVGWCCSSPAPTWPTCCWCGAPPGRRSSRSAPRWARVAGR